MKCAPIVITTLNRVDHLARLLDSLKGNHLSCDTDVYVGLDYPPSDIYTDGYKQVCSYLEGDFTSFKSFTVVKRIDNLGYLNNVDDLVSQILKVHDRFIYMDDDLELSPNFLEYMNSCLDQYEEREDVVAICGYSYPLAWRTGHEATVFEESFICPMWGTGFWRNKYAQIAQYIKEGGLARDAHSTIKRGGFTRLSDIGRREFVDLCLSPDFSVTLAAKVTDISLRLYIAANNKYAIMPVISKVRNWGFDGTGEFCRNVEVSEARISSMNYSYSSQPIDVSPSFLLVSDTCNAIKTNKKLMNGFDLLSLIDRIKVWLKITLFVIVGLSVYHKITVAFRCLKYTYGK